MHGPVRMCPEEDIITKMIRGLDHLSYERERERVVAVQHGEKKS